LIPVARSFEEALARTDRADLADEVKLAEEERAEVLRRFPRERWPELTLAIPESSWTQSSTRLACA